MDRDDYFSLKIPFIPCTQPDAHISSPAFWFIFRGEKLLIQAETQEVSICNLAPIQLDIQPIFSQYLGKYGNTDCFIAEAHDSTQTPPALEFKGLRSLFGHIENDLFTLAGRALQVLHWHREHQFCGKCGTGMIARKDELAKICPNCNFLSFPRLSPAVIMSVIRDDQILLARSPHFPKGMYSTLAGFVEPGETLEEAVKREVLEEVNITVNNIRYFASQPWPFPHSIMIGFSAEYTSGKIKTDGKEIEDAGWFSVNNLPTLPSRITIAHFLIDNFISNYSNFK
jgi:NAD+ diphosphatase